MAKAPARRATKSKASAFDVTAQILDRARAIAHAKHLKLAATVIAMSVRRARTEASVLAIETASGRNVATTDSLVSVAIVIMIDAVTTIVAMIATIIVVATDKLIVHETTADSTTAATVIGIVIATMVGAETVTSQTLVATAIEWIGAVIVVATAAIVAAIAATHLDDAWTLTMATVAAVSILIDVMIVAEHLTMTSHRL